MCPLIRSTRTKVATTQVITTITTMRISTGPIMAQIKGMEEDISSTTITTIGTISITAIIGTTTSITGSPTARHTMGSTTSGTIMGMVRTTGTIKTMAMVTTTGI